MKKLIPLFAFAVLTTFTSLAQTPRDGAILSLNKYDWTITEGEVLEIPVQLVKSKRFQKSEVGNLVMQRRTGLEASVTKDAQNPDLFLLSIKAKDLKAGTYPIILKIDGKNSHRVKQTVIMLQMKGKESIASNNN